MTLQQLRYIIEVFKCNAISKAAENLYMTQPALSKSIKDLEDELGIAILERNNSKIRFTPEGFELVSYAKQVLEQTDFIQQRFSKKVVSDNIFSISTHHYAFTVNAFIHLINENKNTDYKFYFKECQTQEIIEDVASQKSHMGILFMSESSKKYLNRILTAKNLEFHFLKTFSPHVFIRKSHPLSNQSVIYLEQLKQYPCLIFDQGSSSLNFSEEGVHLEDCAQAIFLYDRGATNNILANTDSYNIGTGCLIDGITDSNLLSIPLAGIDTQMSIGWIKLKNTQLPLFMQHYIQFLEQSMKQVQPDSLIEPSLNF